MAGKDAVRAALEAQQIETPSWAYGNSGTRFKVFAQQGVPRDPFRPRNAPATRSWPRRSARWFPASTN
ncbi:hypothetical protein GCM10023205_73290 [Yinghuangia aomiensis]|uniref:Uncharacterized protein n=1 Tax=Yinghuangia aomiensis TaxID=676205 RepID=A0ABP9I7L1_9ACTN